MTIRILTNDDWDAIEALIDTRKKFQTSGMTDELHAKMKEYYVKKRYERDNVFFFGYFENDELTAISSFHRCPAAWDIVAGITWTKAGNETPRWPTCEHYATSIIELRNYAVSWFEAFYNMRSMWIIGPASTDWERLIEVEGCILADRTLYEKHVIMVIPALEFTEDPFIDKYVLVGHTVPTDQVVFCMTRLDWQLPEGMPPIGKLVPSEFPMPERGIRAP
jgi:hypothetical protein